MLIPSEQKRDDFIKFISLIYDAHCDDQCENCVWKVGGNYNHCEYACLLKELRDILFGRGDSDEI